MRNRRMTLFLIALPGTMLAFFLYTGFRLAEGGAEWLACALPFASVLPFFFVVRRRGEKDSLPIWLLTQWVYLNMGFVSFLLVGTFVRDLATFVGHGFPPRYVALGALLALLLATLRGVFGPSVRRVRLRYEGLPGALEGFRIVQISDLHISSSIRARYVRRVVAKARKLTPDLVAFTGDIGDGNLALLAPEVAALSEITKLGAPVFYVAGNHEVYWNLEAWLSAFRKMGMRVLLNQGESLLCKGVELFVGGVTDPAFAMLGGSQGPSVEKASAGMERAAFKMLLSHRPDFADAAAERGFDLQLSGHTHGGQFFPWTLVAHAVHRYSLGTYRIGKMRVYVSAGTGSWGPRLRLGTTAELTLLELTGSDGRKN